MKTKVCLHSLLCGIFLMVVPLHTVLNIMLLYMILKQESISKYFYRKLHDGAEK